MRRFRCEAKCLDGPAPFAHLSAYGNRIWASGTLPSSVCLLLRIPRGARVFVPNKLYKSELNNKAGRLRPTAETGNLGAAHGSLQLGSGKPAKPTILKPRVLRIWEP